MRPAAWAYRDAAPRAPGTVRGRDAIVVSARPSRDSAALLALPPAGQPGSAVLVPAAERSESASCFRSLEAERRTKAERRTTDEQAVEQAGAEALAGRLACPAPTWARAIQAPPRWADSVSCVRDAVTAAGARAVPDRRSTAAAAAALSESDRDELSAAWVWPESACSGAEAQRAHPGRGAELSLPWLPPGVPERSPEAAREPGPEPRELGPELAQREQHSLREAQPEPAAQPFERGAVGLAPPQAGGGSARVAYVAAGYPHSAEQPLPQAVVQARRQPPEVLASGGHPAQISFQEL